MNCSEKLKKTASQPNSLHQFWEACTTPPARGVHPSTLRKILNWLHTFYRRFEKKFCSHLQSVHLTSTQDFLQPSPPSALIPLDLLSPVCTKVPWEGCVCSSRDRSPGSLQDLTTQKCCVDIEYLCLVINVHVCFRFLRILCLFILLCVD